MEEKLSEMYRKELIIPGWAGDVDDIEAGYIKEMIDKDTSVRLKWRRALRSKGYGRICRPSIESVKKWVADLR